MTLEASLAAYERGVKLSRQCQEALSQAQLRIQELKTGADGEATLEEFQLDSDDEHDA